ncbi:MAG: hypothetical protein KDC11_14295 [Chitinophagaceae bacterium]|nr:hypothetical protein [Chitinophagaceae bacterium]
MKYPALIFIVLLSGFYTRAQECDSLIRRVTLDYQDFKGTEYALTPFFTKTRDVDDSELDTLHGSSSAIIGKATEYTYEGMRHFHDYAYIFFYPVKEQNRMYLIGNVISGPSDMGQICYLEITFEDSTKIKYQVPSVTFYALNYFILLEGYVDVINWEKKEKERVYATKGLKELLLSKPISNITKYCREFDETDKDYEINAAYTFKEGQGKDLLQSLKCVNDTPW